MYETHWREPSRLWDHAGENVREWVRSQARAGLSYLHALERPFLK